MISITKCCYCYSELNDDPLILPCGLTICSDHIDRNKSEKVDCLICKNSKDDDDHHSFIPSKLSINRLAQIKTLVCKIENLHNELEFCKDSINQGQNIDCSFLEVYFNYLEIKCLEQKQKIEDLVTIHYDKLNQDIESKMKNLIRVSHDKLSEEIKLDTINDIYDEIHKNETIRRSLKLYEEKIDLACAEINRLNNEINTNLSSLLNYEIFVLEKSNLDKVNFDELFGKLDSESLNSESPKESDESIENF